MRRHWLVLTVALAGCAESAVAAPGATPPPPAPVPVKAPVPPAPGTPAPLSEDMAKPHFQTGDAAAGATAFAKEKWADAVLSFTKARVKAKGDDAARIDLMIGLALENQSKWDIAGGKLVAAGKGLPLLADYINYHAARSLYFAHDNAKALALATTIPADSIVGADAELLTGDLTRTAGDPAKTIAFYQGYLSRRPDGPRKSEARYRIAEAMEQSKGDAAQIVALYHVITVEDPLSAWTTRANERLAKLAPKDALTAAEHITKGKVLFDSMRNPEGEAEFTAALADPAITPADKCVAAYHAAQSRFKARDRKGAAPMFDVATTACHVAANTDLEIKSVYQAGRSYAFNGDHTTAVARYEAAEKVDPKHSYADDALLREAEEWADLNNDAKVKETLGSLPTKYPTGDNVAEAMWRLGWRAWRDKKLDEAIGWWKKQIELVPHDDNYFAEGQAQYWLGRAYAAKGNKAAALDNWEAGIVQYPAAYYALQGLNRIRETDAQRYQKVLAAISVTPAGFDPAAPAFVFKPRVEWGSPGFLRAMEFVRLGLGDVATAELKKAKLAPPTDKKRVDDPDQIEKLWAIAYLYDRAGRYQSSLWPTRWAILDYRKTWPTGANKARWQIAYPKGYWEILTRHAAKNNLPVEMQVAIVREESGFEPTTESYANAWGLTQMIPPTAKQFAEGTGIAPTRENMFDPEMNVTVGSRFLGSLFKQWKDFALLVPPSYNAGPGAVKRMLKVRGTWDADEFIEAIVDDQARNYSKRVLGTYFTYNWLYSGNVPVMPLLIPKDLLPKT
ncbi:MAG TPA: transglycosylase SLT domain-containing protein [Kofleriaceae bacterium]